MAQLPLIFNLNYQSIWLADLGNALMRHTFETFFFSQIKLRDTVLGIIQFKPIEIPRKFSYVCYCGVTLQMYTKFLGISWFLPFIGCHILFNLSMLYTIVKLAILWFDICRETEQFLRLVWQAWQNPRRELFKKFWAASGPRSNEQDI